MLAPPPEGTFDIDEQSLPIKSPRDGKTPGQVPLLTHEEHEEEQEETDENEVVEINPNSSKKSKVKMT